MRFYRFNILAIFLFLCFIFLSLLNGTFEFINLDKPLMSIAFIYLLTRIPKIKGKKQ